jgi:IS66 C-terminal element
MDSHRAYLYSMVGICRRLDLDPWAYLPDVFTRLPSHSIDQFDELLPGPVITRMGRGERVTNDAAQWFRAA